MNTHQNISDELLAKYMSGKATLEEEEAVLDYLASSDEHLDDFLIMSSSSKMHSQENKRKSINIHNKHRLIWFASAAASVAILVVVGFFVFYQNQSPETQFVQGQTNQVQPTETPVVQDSICQETENTPQTSVDNNTIPKIQEAKHYADSARKKNYANMLYPSTKLSSIPEGRQTVMFRWKTDAVEIHLSIISNDNNTLVNQSLGTAKFYNYTLPKDADTIQWQATFTFANGNTSVKNGTLIRWDTGVNTAN